MEITNNNQTQMPAETEEKNSNQTFLIVIAGVIVLFIILLLVFISGSKKKTVNYSQNIPEVSPVPTVIQEKGVLSLKSKTGKTNFSVGQTITLVVNAYSDNKPITGYDAVIKTDDNLLKYLGQKSLNPNFQLFTSVKPNQIYLTGVKKLNTNEEIVFDNTDIAELTFKVLKSGTINLGLDFVPGSKKDSNLIDNQSADQLGKVEGITLNLASQTK
ncbi:MAG: cohesin domain-containing protein [Microgenomates group bacterium]|nr:cohesin domain-containing protein [Microgenomates group bacterium]